MESGPRRTPYPLRWLAGLLGLQLAIALVTWLCPQGLPLPSALVTQVLWPLRPPALQPWQCQVQGLRLTLLPLQLSCQELHLRPTEPCQTHAAQQAIAAAAALSSPQGTACQAERWSLQAKTLSVGLSLGPRGCRLHWQATGLQVWHPGLGHPVVCDSCSGSLTCGQHKHYTLQPCLWQWGQAYLYTHVDVAAKPLHHWLQHNRAAALQWLARLGHTQALWLEHLGAHLGTADPGPGPNLAAWQVPHVPHLPPGTWGALAITQTQDGPQVQASVYMPELHLPAWGVKAKALGLQAQHSIVGPGPSQLRYTLEARGMQLATVAKGTWQARHLQLCLSYCPTAAGTQRPHAQLFLGGITSHTAPEPYPIDLDLRAWLFRSGVYRLDAGVHASRCQRPLGRLTLQLRGHCLKRWAQLCGQAQCTPHDWVPYLGQAFEQALGLQCTQPLHAWVYTRWDKGSKPSKAQDPFANLHGHVVLPACRIHDIPLRGGAFYASYAAPGHYRLWDIDLRALQPGPAAPASVIRVQGSYSYQHADHRLRLEGQLWPSWIDRWMQDWWPELWQRFALGTTPPWGDVDVRFNLNDPERTLVFGAARAQDCHYLQIPLSRCDLVFYAKPLYFGMHNLRLLHAQQGSAQADIAWTYAHSDSEQLNALHFDLSSSMPFEAVARASESPFCQQLSQQLQFAAPVALQARGSYYTDQHALWGQDKLWLTATSWMPLTVYGVDLSYLDLSLQQKGNAVTLEPIRFGLCGGRGQARAQIQLPFVATTAQGLQNDATTACSAAPLASQSPNSDISTHLADQAQDAPKAPAVALQPDLQALRPRYPWVQVWGSLEQAHYTLFEQTLKRLHPIGQGSGTSHAATMMPQTAGAPNVGGKLKLTLQSQGYWGQPASFTGQGTLALREAQLGQIHLLGGLSRIINKGPLGLGSLKFNELHANYSFADASVSFDHVHITGPTARLSGHGRYQLADQVLAFRMQLHLLGGLRIPVVSGLLRLLDPFSKIFSLRLQGTLAEPQWVLSPHFLPL